jgi:hypothetical protein
MRTIIYFLTVISIALFPALAETAKERAHEAVAAVQPPTDDSEKLAAQQINKSISALKEALKGMIDSRKKGERNSFSLYKQQAIDALNELSKQASREINTEAAAEANEIKSGTLPSPTEKPTPPEATPTPTPEATPTPTPEATPTPTPEATPTPTPEATPTSTPEATATPTPQ